MKYPSSYRNAKARTQNGASSGSQNTGTRPDTVFAEPMGINIPFPDSLGGPLAVPIRPDGSLGTPTRPDGSPHPAREHFGTRAPRDALKDFVKGAPGIAGLQGFRPDGSPTNSLPHPALGLLSPEARKRLLAAAALTPPGRLARLLGLLGKIMDGISLAELLQGLFGLPDIEDLDPQFHHFNAGWNLTRTCPNGKPVMHQAFVGASYPDPTAPGCFNSQGVSTPMGVGSPVPSNSKQLWHISAANGLGRYDQLKQWGRPTSAGTQSPTWPGLSPLPLNNPVPNTDVPFHVIPEKPTHPQSERGNETPPDVDAPPPWTGITPTPTPVEPPTPDPGPLPPPPPVPPGTIPPTMTFNPWRPKHPGPKIKEKKTKATGLNGVLRGLTKFMHSMTEFKDFIDALFEALPKWVQRKCKGKGLACKEQQLSEHWDRINVNKAIENLIYNHIEDKVIGALNKQFQDGITDLTGKGDLTGGRGPTWGIGGG